MIAPAAIGEGEDNTSYWVVNAGSVATPESPLRKDKVPVRFP